MSKLVDVVIEIPYNSYVKYEYDEIIDKIRCDRILNTSMLYPGNYGYIPNTIAGDGDPLDILMICEYPIFPGVVIETKVVGVLIMEDEKGLDEKLIVVPSSSVDKNYNDVNELDDLPRLTLNKIKHFFTHYKDNDEGKWCSVKDFHDSEYALNLIRKYSNSNKRIKLM